MPQELARIAIGLPGMESLAPQLPGWFANLSIGRAQIAAEQIRSSILNHTGSREQPNAGLRSDDLVIVTARLADRAVAAAIAIHPQHQHPSRSDGSNTNAPSTDLPSDTATVIHAGWLTAGDSEAGRSDRRESAKAAVISELSAALDQQLQRRGASFLQWATDAIPAEPEALGDDAGSDEVAQWCWEFGFEPLATLDYLSGEVTAAAIAAATIAAASTLRFQPLPFQPVGDDRSQASSGRSFGMADSDFVRLVEQTYEGTRDCPRLGEYRTAAQTLHSYQNAPAFDPNLWFTVHDPDDCQPIGCLILANHRDTALANRSVMVELVYMGLIPAARQRRWGQQLVAQAFRSASELGADRMMAAVDQQNLAARRLYQRAGLQWMLSETVWGKSLSSS